jgi:predicted RNase H-like nuclease
MVQIAGIDGCKSRWLAISHEPGSSILKAMLLNTDELSEQPWALATIDIPIGIPERGSREADIQARKFVKPRGSSVFPCPIRPTLSAQSWSEACEITHSRDGRNVSQQTFAILPKIRTVDECIRATSLGDRLFEIHPEVSFAAWQGEPMSYPKRDPRGQENRRALIADYFGKFAYTNVASQVQGKGVAADDISDAFAALWSANRLYSGIANRLPTAPQFDAYGLPMHIWY